MKTVAIVQSSYIPWKGYFDLINSVDEFIFLDDVQFTRRDWRNRNRVKTPDGVVWMTIPVVSHGRYLQRIDETVAMADDWRRRHWQTLVHNYARAPYFHELASCFEQIFRGSDERRLSLINRTFIEAVCGVLGITTELRWSSEYAVEGVKTERLVRLCERAGATAYLSGPTARAYIDESMFAERGITVEYMDYADYPAYPQLHPPFDHHVTALDLLFHTGAEAPMYMKSFNRRHA